VVTKCSLGFQFILYFFFNIPQQVKIALSHINHPKIKKASDRYKFYFFMGIKNFYEGDHEKLMNKTSEVEGWKKKRKCS